MSLFDNMPGGQTQTAIAFPASLTEKYRPHTFAEFVGLDRPKKILTKFACAPYPSAWRFIGPPGTGKTTMAITLCEAIKGEFHHIPSQKCNVEALEEVIRQCHYYP